MSAEAQRFARLVLDRFRELGLETDQEVAEAGGPSTSTMTKLRAALDRGNLPRPRSDTMRRIDTAAEWVRGSARHVYDGGDPVARAAPEPPTWRERIEASNLEDDLKQWILGNPRPDAPPPERRSG